MLITRAGFVSELISMCPNDFRTCAKIWAERYISALNEVQGEIDFKKLWKIFEDEHVYLKPPSIPWLKYAAKKARIRKKTAIETKTITAIIGNSICEFGYINEDEIQKSEILKKADAWIYGTIYGAPPEFLERVKKIQEKTKREINGIK